MSIKKTRLHFAFCHHTAAIMSRPKLRLKNMLMHFWFDSTAVGTTVQDTSDWIIQDFM